ncbi:histidine kinase [Halorubrum ezzemoulense]|uniref:histidine kinase n=1 Tax=Halorubrum ezzemoulense TaxID=337243 RepID=A0A256IRC5_HALEZ|nr:PAS domain-containing protein [Halorubrum ezzemoulense]OYR59109.1 histidine kinase [Halorubrum ezzemoulense]
MSAEPTLHLGEPVDAAWGELPAETRVRRASEVASDADRDPDRSVDPARVVVRLFDDETRGDRDAPELNGDGAAGRGLSVERDAAALDRLESVRNRYPDAAVLAYSAGDDADAAIDASRLGIEYVSGRRLAADGETLADRVEAIDGGRDDRDGAGTEPAHDGPGPESPDAGGPEPEPTTAGGPEPEPTTAGGREFLEPFVRIVSDRCADLDEQVDALLDLGRDYLDLSIGYSSRVEGDRIEIQRYRDSTGLVESIAADELDDDGTLPLELTYCRRTVRGGAGAGPESDGAPGSGEESGGDGATEGGSETGGDGAAEGDSGVVTITDPEAAGLAGDPAYERSGVGSYVGGRVVVDGEVYGTLCFLDVGPRDRPFDASERLFVELLAEWLGGAIEREVVREERAAAVDRFEETLDRIEDGFFALDDEFRFTYVNEAAATLLDRDADELIGADIWAEFPAALGRKYERNYRRAMETQEVVSFEDRYEPLDLWTDVTAYPSPNGLSVFFADVSERKRREQTLERLLGTVERVQRESDADGVAERLVEAADQILGYQISGVRLFDEDADLLRLAATSEGIGDAFAASRDPRPPSEGITGAVFRDGETWVCDDLATDERLASIGGGPSNGDRTEYHGMRSFVAVPLGDHGVFIVGSREPDAFGESDVSVLELLATNAVATMDANDRRRRLRTYEDALKNVDDMVCVLDGDGAVTYATGPFAEWVGAGGTGDIVGRRLDALVAPDDAERVVDAVGALTGTPAEVAGGREPTRTVDLSVERDGDRGPRHGRLRLSSLSDRGGGVVGSLSDTTDLFRTRTELSAERDRFRRLFDRIPDPVIEVVFEDDETVIDGANPAFEAQFGVDEAALRGRTIEALDIHDYRLGDSVEASAVEAADLDALVREHGFAAEEIRRQTVEGPREFLFRGFSYETEGDRRAFGIYTDITDRKRRERYVRIVNRILRHNLRNELNVVFGFAGEIADRTDDDRIRDYARRIETTGKRLTDVAEGAGTLRGIVEEGYATDPEPVDVGPIVEAVTARHAADRPDTRITADVPAGIAVRGDDRLSVAIDHLVENAVEHGGDAPRVAVSAERDLDGGVVRVSVADDGPGVPTAVREVITGVREVTQLQHNTGVGLWIAAWVVEAYGGEIRFDDGLGGGGTTVTLVLPAAE